MHALYAFVAGPLAWAAFILFFGGIVYRLVRLLVQVNKSEKFIWKYMSLKYSLRSLLHWVTPFGTVNWRLNPVLTVVTFVFHIGLLATPLLLLGHVVLVDEAWNLSWWTLPDALADTMTGAGDRLLCVLLGKACREAGSEIRQRCVGFYPVAYRGGPFRYRFSGLPPMARGALDDHFAYVERRDHAGGHSVYTVESYDFFRFYKGLYGVRVWQGKACPGLVVDKINGY